MSKEQRPSSEHDLLEPLTQPLLRHHPPKLVHRLGLVEPALVSRRHRSMRAGRDGRRLGDAPKVLVAQGLHGGDPFAEALLVAGRGEHDARAPAAADEDVVDVELGGGAADAVEFLAGGDVVRADEAVEEGRRGCRGWHCRLDDGGEQGPG